jgi:hypothetical protein
LFGLLISFWWVGITLGVPIFILCLVKAPGLLFRITGRDALLRRATRQVDSYWISKQMPEDEVSYFRQS